MSNYGRNFEFRIPPEGNERYGRVKVPNSGVPLPIGAPVSLDVNVATDSMGLDTLTLLTTATAPKAGKHGIVVYEYKNTEAFAGVDPLLTMFSDLNTVPLGAAAQLVSGPHIKVLFRNTASQNFLHSRTYPAYTIVAGLGATPTLAVGDYLTPGTGNNSAGYWTEDASAANAWFVITRVDNSRGEVEARMTF